MPLTDKQKNILLQNGWNEEEIAEVPYDEASDAIGEILSKRKPRQESKYKKEVYSPEIVKVAHEGFKAKEQPYKSSFDVSYSKDLLIAMLVFQAELVKAGFIKDARQLESIEAIGLKASAVIKGIDISASIELDSSILAFSAASRRR